MFKRKAGSKYGAIKTEVDGNKFDSKVEAKYYLHLKELERIGKITKLELQPSFTLMQGFRREGLNNEKIRDIKYNADFMYFDIMQGRFIIADVKGGDSTPEFKIKAKMLLKMIEEGVENKYAIFHEVRFKAKAWEIIER